jgi:hypothetical protein
MRVTFFHAGAGQVGSAAGIDPDREPGRFVRGEHAWTVQTWARLARAGFPVELADRPPRDGIVVFHAKERRILARALPLRADLVLVGIRADSSSPGLADVEVLQNGHFADGRRRVFIPSWPQPGLVPRDPTRGETIGRVAFKGFARNLDAAFHTAAWGELLAGRGIEWVFDAVEFQRHRELEGSVAWHDYSAVDVVVAVRPPDRRLHTAKPAAKLTNAWLAGVPALLGPEVAYRELRRSELDYLEVSDLDEARAAVRRLQEHPGLYREMVDNGRRRAPEFDCPALVERWRALLFDRLPAFAASSEGRRLRRLPIPLKALARRLGRPFSSRPAR